MAMDAELEQQDATGCQGWGKRDAIPSGYVKIAIENHHFYWENQLFLWPFSIAILT